uniref:Uncharacterized protein n=1 Tax=Glossina pallidipes TaxID=7398 RepID=A0A1A9Z3A2_GLOPL
MAAVVIIIELAIASANSLEIVQVFSEQPSASSYLNMKLFKLLGLLFVIMNGLNGLTDRAAVIDFRPQISTLRPPVIYDSPIRKPGPELIYVVVKTILPNVPNTPVTADLDYKRSYFEPVIYLLNTVTKAMDTACYQITRNVS